MIKTERSEYYDHSSAPSFPFLWLDRKSTIWLRTTEDDICLHPGGSLFKTGDLTLHLTSHEDAWHLRLNSSVSLSNVKVT